MQQVGRYQVLEEIARGGMGVVFKALDPATRRVVALKLLLSLDNEVARKRFKREAEALAKVSHRNVVRLFDYGLTETGEPYMVIELVEGESLQQRLDRDGPLDPDEAADAATTLCHAVAACHAVGVLHRDLKPDNVLVARDGTIKLTDFGLVRDTEPSTSRTQLSVQGRFLGSPGYWAPEQAGGDLARIGERTDVYGLGATLFALLTGRPPHSGQSLGEILRAVQEAKPSPSSLNPAIPAWLDAVVGRALATEPEARFEGVEAFAAALDGRALGGGASTRWAALLASLALVILGLAGALVVVTRRKVEAGTPGVAVSRPPSALGSRPSAAPIASSSPVPTAAKNADEEAVREALNRGASRLSQGDFRGAIQDYTEAIRLQPDLAAAYTNRGLAREGQGNLQGALDEFTQAIRVQPGYVDAYVNRGVTRANLGDPQGAIEDYNEAIRLDPDHALAYSNRGAVHATLGDYQRSSEDSTEAIRLDPDFADAYCNRGIARKKLGNFQGAVEDHTQAIRLEPDNFRAYFDRGVAHSKLGDYRRALEDYTEAIRLDPDHALTYQTRALAHANLGDYQRALEDATEAIRLDPEHALSYHTRASVRANLRDYPRAIEDWERALALEPSASWAPQARSFLQSARQDLAEQQDGGD